MGYVQSRPRPGSARAPARQRCTVSGARRGWCPRPGRWHHARCCRPRPSAVVADAMGSRRVVRTYSTRRHSMNRTQWGERGGDRSPPMRGPSAPIHSFPLAEPDTSAIMAGAVARGVDDGGGVARVCRPRRVEAATRAAARPPGRGRRREEDARSGPHRSERQWGGARPPIRWRSGAVAPLRRAPPRPLRGMGRSHELCGIRSRVKGATRAAGGRNKAFPWTLGLLHCRPFESCASTHRIDHICSSRKRSPLLSFHCLVGNRHCDTPRRSVDLVVVSVHTAAQQTEGSTRLRGASWSRDRVCRPREGDLRCPGGIMRTGGCRQRRGRALTQGRCVRRQAASGRGGRAEARSQPRRW